MKRILYVFWLFLFLTACATQMKENLQAFPPEVPISEPKTLKAEPTAPESEPTKPEFLPVNPNPVEFLEIQAGKRYAYTGREQVEMPAAPFVENGVFYFPLQFVAEAMGVQYAFSDGCAYLKYDEHMTQFFTDSPHFIVDGVESQVEGERTLFCEGLPKAPVDESFTPLLRDGIVFLPVDYLPVEHRRSYNSFGAQMCPSNENLVRFQNDLFSSEQMETSLAVTLSPNVPAALVDGKRMPLPAAPFVENGIFFFPVEAVAEWMGVGYSRTGETFCLSDTKHEVQLFLNSRRYILDGQPGLRENMRSVFAASYKDNRVPADDSYVPVERDGVVFLPTDYFCGDPEAFEYISFFSFCRGKRCRGLFVTTQLFCSFGKHENQRPR